jgi:hypothetical protein
VSPSDFQAFILVGERLSIAIGALAGAVMATLSYLKSRENHVILNSQRTEMVGQIRRLTQIIALPDGPEKKRLMAEMNLPPENLEAATEAARIAESHPKTGGVP